ncbi:hypothetical protein GCM10008905_10880 [Clostridium malenominatum]|uniref:Uncharacterized protein n=1 Tax=Clostridium malenominatum TaxID=1539 RepID=A0ABP3U2V6_9CLOT
MHATPSPINILEAKAIHKFTEYENRIEPIAVIIKDKATIFLVPYLSVI